MMKKNSVIDKIKIARKVVFKEIIKDLFVGFVVGVAVVLATYYMDNVKEIKRVNRELQSIALGESEGYIVDRFGIPIISYTNEGLTNSYFKMKNCVLRCVFEDKSLVAFIITVDSDDVYRVKSNIFLDKERKLKDFTYSDFNNNDAMINYICNVPANNDDYAFYQEMYYGAGPADYNYFIIGNYKDFKRHSKFIDILQFPGETSSDEEQKPQEYYEVRKKLCPNSFGMIKDGFEDEIDLIDSCEEIRIYGKILYEDFY